MGSFLFIANIPEPMNITLRHRLPALGFFLIFNLSGLLTFVAAQTVPDPPAQHPRILLLAGEEKKIQDAIRADPAWMKMHQAILDESDNIISLPPVEHVKIGRRLLDKSREALRRIFHLAYAYRLTGNEKYAQRAEKEMLAIAAFSDWNPTHYLDVGEMTMALAIGYDWIYPTLSPESRKTISEAIIEKGLKTSQDERYNSWLERSNNWNQVCNAGITYGALAVYEAVPDLSKQLIKRAINSIKLPMEDYAPDGAYPEGYGYWNYGTTFQVLFLSAMEKAFGSDYGLSRQPGFMATARYYENMIGSSGYPFNYSDAGSGKGKLSPAMFYFAQKSNDPSLLWIEKQYMNQPDISNSTSNRVFPLLMLVGTGTDLNKVTPPRYTLWTGQGKSPVALIRSSWTAPDAIFIGFKAGSPSAPHAHMDIGSFVMDADGVRWALDLGSQDYNSLESRGMDIWGKEQDSQRWTVKRYNNFIHNTLTVNDQYQKVKGYAKIDKSGESKELKFAVSDLSDMYNGQLAAAQRGIGIVDDTYVVVRDEVKAPGKPAKVRWVMLAPEGIKTNGTNTAVLTKDGKQLTLRVDAPANAKLQTWSSAPTTDYDAPNEGTVLVGFEYEVPAGASQTMQVSLIPGSTKPASATMNKPLAQWGKK
jgi:hypothetical protein